MKFSKFSLNFGGFSNKIQVFLIVFDFFLNFGVYQGLLNDRNLITYHHQDGEVSAEEFLKAIEANCGNKTYDQLPPAFKAFITGTFKSIDVDGTSKGRAKIKGRKVKDKNRP